MSQELFEYWHAGKNAQNYPFYNNFVADEKLFLELNEEQAVLQRLINENNPWEAFLRLNSWLHAFSKYMTWYNGETGSHQRDSSAQHAMIKCLRWLADNRTLIAKIIVAIGGEYHSITTSPSGITLTVSFSSRTQAGEGNEYGVTSELNTPQQPLNSAQPDSGQQATRVTAPRGTGVSIAPQGVTPTSNDMRSNTLNPNNTAFTAAVNNRANQMNPNSRAFRASRGSKK